MISIELVEKIKNKEIIIDSPMNAVLVDTSRSDSKTYYNLTTGEVFYSKLDLLKKHAQNEIFLIKAAPAAQYSTYIKYHEDLDLVTISRIVISRWPAEPGEVRSWNIIDTLYVTNEKEVFHLTNGRVVQITKEKELPFKFKGDILETSFERNSMLNAFNKLFSVNDNRTIYFTSSSKCNTLNKMDILAEFLFFKDILKKDGPKQQKIDKLCAEVIETYIDYEDLLESVEMSCLDNYFTTNFNCYKLERINDKYAVLRIFSCNQFYKTTEEVIRIFIGKKDVIYTRINYKGEFVNLRSGIQISFYDTIKSFMYGFSESIIVGTRLEYYKDFIFNIPLGIRGTMISLMLKYPIVEKLYKLGLGKYINYAYRMSPQQFVETNFLNPLYDMFYANTNETENVLRFLGLSTSQLNKILGKFPNFNDKLSIPEQTFPIAELKKLLGSRDISSLDDVSFDVYLESYFVYHDYSGRKSSFDYLQRSIDRIRSLYSRQTALSLMPKMIMLAITPMENEPDTHRGVSLALNYYHDYLNMIHRMNDTRNFRPNFSTIEDVKLMHDNALEVYNLHKEEYAINAFNKNKKKWKKFIYKNDTLMVIYPETPEEMAKEGIELHHCVKSYIDRVTNGTTNILFIRKVSDPEKPFFTVEISNEGVIEQVHGFGNRNANTEEGLNDFINEWKKELKLKSRSINKVR